MGARSDVVLVLCLCFLGQVVRSEIRHYHLKLEPTPESISYSQGLIRGAGSVDLSNLVFDVAGYEDDDFAIDDDDDDDDLFRERKAQANQGERFLHSVGGQPTAGSSSSRGPPFLAQMARNHTQTNAVSVDTSVRRREQNKNATNWSVIDIVFFRMPDECANKKHGCDWYEFAKLGVGATGDDDDDYPEWCCSDEAVQRGLCPEKTGRMIIDGKKFSGEHRFVPYPPTGRIPYKQRRLVSPVFQTDAKSSTGTYMLIFVNCDDDGRAVTVQGTCTWKSKNGFLLPGHLFGKMYFFFAVAVVYFLALLWYGITMHANAESTIPLQKWILLTIGIALLEAILRFGDLVLWNMNGSRMQLVVYSGVVIGVIKRGVSRCLILMVSLGWGVVSDRLERLRCVVALGCLYIVVAATHDTVEEIDSLSKSPLPRDTEVNHQKVKVVTDFATVAIDVTFGIWILVALRRTVRYLQTMNQTMKLRRFLWLRWILVPYMIFAVTWAVLGYTNVVADALEQDKVWALAAAWYLNYLLVVVAVATLWRPNATAKDFAQVMELPTVGHDLELDSNAIETTDEVDNYHGSMTGKDDGLRIDSAVVS